jgi:hypothetical protein
MRVSGLLIASTAALLATLSGAQLRGAAVEADGATTADKAAGSWYIADHDVGLRCVGTIYHSYIDCFH